MEDDEAGDHDVEDVVRDRGPVQAQALEEEDDEDGDDHWQAATAPVRWLIG